MISRDTIFQSDLWGNVTVAGDVVDHITYILQEFPETRNDYKALMARYWMMFDGLDSFLGDTPRSDDITLLLIRREAAPPVTGPTPSRSPEVS